MNEDGEARQRPLMLTELCNWLERRNRDQEDPIVRTELRYEGAHLISPISDYKFSTVDEAATEAWEEAAVHASQYQATAQYYQLHIFRKSEPKRTRGHFRWLLEGQLTESGGFGLAAHMGHGDVVAMLARHIEAKEKFTGSIVAQTLQMLQGELARKDARVVELETQRLQGWKAMDELLEARHEHEIRAFRELSAEKRKDAALESFQLLLPAIASGVANKAGLPVTASPEIAGLRQLLASMTPAQMQQWFATLTPTQQATVMMIMRRLGGMPSKPEDSPPDATH